MINPGGKEKNGKPEEKVEQNPNGNIRFDYGFNANGLRRHSVESCCRRRRKDEAAFRILERYGRRADDSGLESGLV